MRSVCMQPVRARDHSVLLADAQRRGRPTRIRTRCKRVNRLGVHAWKLYAYDGGAVLGNCAWT